ncbi:MAG: RtcB family protein [Actinomycetaceae bacterium]|nr:RtcB family protein [Actinomycetaceae bacterium]
MSRPTFPIPLPGSEADALMWADPAEVEDAALDQLRHIAELPWLRKLRVMPDVHLGKGATVGSVIAMEKAISPAAVGVDIGCGMAAVRTSLTASQLPDDLSRLRRAIEKVVPVGRAGHKEIAGVIGVDPALRTHADSVFAQFDDLHAEGIWTQEQRMLSQCGSLGGGNHFIEVCLDESDQVWIMLHSGSRGIGNQVAAWHIERAKGLHHNMALSDPDLAVFIADTPQMDAYLHDLYWAQDYARLNREVMIRLVKDAVRTVIPPVKYGEEIQCHHNYVAQEEYDGVELVVTRKGAIRAGSGDLGLIPGSMGTGSYVVRGLGNETGLCSASHGAGRRMSRNAAKKRFTEEDLAAQTAGVECRKDAGVIDEIPGAYKDLEQVISAQTQGPSPLVEVVQRLRTIVCVKG